MSPKRSESHAALRVAERYNEVSMASLKACISAGHFDFIKRQSCSRSVCKALVDGHVVWFILNRPNRSIVTVLTEDQAQSQL